MLLLQSHLYPGFHRLGANSQGGRVDCLVIESGRLAHENRHWDPGADSKLRLWANYSYSSGGGLRTIGVSCGQSVSRRLAGLTGRLLLFGLTLPMAEILTVVAFGT